MATKAEAASAQQDALAIAEERAGPADGPVFVTLNRKKYKLCYDLNALSYIGDKLGIQLRLGQIGEDLLNVPLPLSALRTLVYAGIMAQVGDDVTEVDVGGWVTQENMQDVAQAFFSLFGASLQDLNPLGMPSSVGSVGNGQDVKEGH